MAAAAEPAPSTSIAPNQCLYFRNIYEKVKKNPLKRMLYALCSPFGRILDVVAVKTMKLRGQAWIVFADLPAATTALRHLQGFGFLGKPLAAQFAKGKSEAVAKLDGTFVAKHVKRKHEADAAGARKRKRGPPGAAPAPVGSGVVGPLPLAEPSGAVVPGPAAAPAPAPEPAPAPVPALPSVDPGRPSRVILAENLPPAMQPVMLEVLFKQYPGFNEVRLVPGKFVAFVHFEEEHQAGVALAGLQHFKLTPQHPMRLTFARQ